jgi:flagellar biosynthesis protein FlhB
MADQKTEKPTKKRLLKAREEGRGPSTRQFIAGAQFCFIVVLLNAKGADWLNYAVVGFRGEIKRAFVADVSQTELLHLGSQLLYACFFPMLYMGGAMVAAGLGVHLAATRMQFSVKKLTPDFQRLSPMNKIKQLPRQNLISAVQSLILLPVFAWVIYAVAAAQAERFFVLPMASLRTGLLAITSPMQGLLWKAAGIFFIFGCMELFRETKRYNFEMKMSKQEIKDENKETQGNPLIKQRLRTIRRDQARKRMMQAVPTATAVIVNPTHYAVALKYDPLTMAAPLVVAKGKNYLALRIKQKAIDHGVPIIENPPLAQGLYKSVDVGQEIPQHLYRAIAEILAYIFRLTNK